MDGCVYHGWQGDPSLYLLNLISLKKSICSYPHCLSPFPPSSFFFLHQASQDRMSGFSPQSLCNLAWAMSTLNFTPRPSWTLALVDASSRKLHETSPAVSFPRL